MVRTVAVLVLVLPVVALCGADTYVVTNPNDSGLGSLRRAINQANTHSGADLIRFKPTMAGKVIKPLTQLPAIADDETTLNGDINGDGAPDVAINGSMQSSGPILWITGDFCHVRGLAVAGSPEEGIAMTANHSCSILSCHLGVNLAGTDTVPNTDADLAMYGCRQNTIGNGRAKFRNVIGAGAGKFGTGVHVEDGYLNDIVGNYVGVKRDGTAAFGDGGTGIYLYGSSTAQSISNAVKRNLFGGLEIAVRCHRADGNAFYGNYFGLAVDGRCCRSASPASPSVRAVRATTSAAHSPARVTALSAG